MKGKHDVFDAIALDLSFPVGEGYQIGLNCRKMLRQRRNKCRGNVGSHVILELRNPIKQMSLRGLVQKKSM